MKLNPSNQLELFIHENELKNLIFLYFFINCAMITGLIPIVGVPIPMLSYGGSAIISLCAAMGFVLNARRQRDIKIESILDA